MRLESTPPDNRQPTGHVGDHAAVDGDPQRFENRVLPVLFGPVGSCPSRRLKSGAQYVVVVRRPSGSIATSVAGGTLDTPRRIVCGGGTTEWKVR